LKEQRLLCLCAVLISLGGALPVHAEDGPGWTFSGHFQGSSNSSGLVMKADPSLGYSFSRHSQVYVGLPFYFVNRSSTTTTTTSTSGFVNGIGNAFVGLHLGVSHQALDFDSNVEATAPTGDKDKGFSTGRATVDWTNRFSHTFSAITPFARVGVANTVSDTSFFVRPFSSLGLVTHFDGGAELQIAPLVTAGASAYGIRGSGEQRIFSKVKNNSLTAGAGTTSAKRVFDTNSETVGSADLTNDKGFSGWLAIHARSGVDFQAGYTRSVGYDLNTFFFGVGFRVGN